MNSMKQGTLTITARHHPSFLLNTSLFILLNLSACSPQAAPAKPPANLDPPAKAQITPTEVKPIPTTDPTPLPTSTPEQKLIYPYYLPRATKPDSASETIEGVSAQIDWAYVDESRVALHYTISGLDWPDGTSLDPMQQVQMTSKAVPDLWRGSISGNSSPADQGVITGSIDQRLVEGALQQEQHPNIPLHVDIPVEGASSVGTFRFNLDLPVLAGSKLEDMDQTVEANGVAMTLKELWLTPSYVEALICFQMPSEVDWGLTASILTLADREYSYSSGGLMPGADGKNFSLTDPERCSSIGFDIVGDESAKSLTLNVPKLLGSVPEVITSERVERANQRLAENGIEFQYVAVDHGGNIQVLKRPKGKTDQEIFPLIWEALADQYQGPWAFTVSVK